MTSRLLSRHLLPCRLPLCIAELKGNQMKKEIILRRREGIRDGEMEDNQSRIDILCPEAHMQHNLTHTLTFAPTVSAAATATAAASGPAVLAAAGPAGDAKPEGTTPMGEAKKTERNRKHDKH